MLIGDAGDDFLFGNEGNDLILGLDGNDVAYGQAGDDTIFGGLGNDSLYGNTGNRCDSGREGPFRPIHSVPIAMPDDGNDLIAGGAEDFDVIDGGNGNNFLDAGDDGIREMVVAGSGNDVGYPHDNSGTGPNGHSDKMALDGGRNLIIPVGALVIPPSPSEPFYGSAGITPPMSA